MGWQETLLQKRVKNNSKILCLYNQDCFHVVYYVLIIVFVFLSDMTYSVYPNYINIIVVKYDVILNIFLCSSWHQCWYLNILWGKSFHFIEARWAWIVYRVRPGVRPDVIECRAVSQSTVDNLTEDCRPINTVEDNSLTEVLKAALQERRAP